MNPAICSIALIVAVALFSTGASAGTMLNPTDLRCEYKADPISIDIPHPRLSWVLQSNDPSQRGQRQTAYQIIVSSSEKNLAADHGDLWDTGRVKSDDTIQIPYQGRTLSSEEKVFWKVRVWNESGSESNWSAPAFFAAALLQPGDWKAKWIGYDAPAKPFVFDDKESQLNLENLKWVWTDEGDPLKDAPKGTRYFAKKIELPVDAKIAKAMLMCVVDDKLNLIVNGHAVGEASGFKTTSTLDFMSLLHGGGNMLAIDVENAGGPAGLLGRAMIWLKGADKPITIDIDATWHVSKQLPKDWKAGTFDPSGWPNAKPFADLGAATWGIPETKAVQLPPPAMLRKSFVADKPIRRAILHASALGIYELQLNGHRVGDDYFTPGWTDYKKRVYYNTFDVTGQIKHGGNVLAGLLAQGWYAGYYAWGLNHNWYGKHPRLLAQLDIEFADGSKQSIITDDSWKCSYGPWLGADLIMGCAYDSTREIPGWDKPGFDDTSWRPAIVAKSPKIKISAYPGDPVRIDQQLQAKKITEPTPGAYVFDLGQNMVGWIRLNIHADRGEKIVLRYSEMLTKEGTPYTVSLRGAKATDTLIARGGEQSWEPKFTSHGFRYVEIAGLKHKPALDAVTGIVAHADMSRTGEFTCSSPLVNQLFHNIIWGQKGNYFEVPTDCPQRDERLGWTGDAQFFIPTAAYNFDVAAFFTKWLVDLDTDAQYPDGSFADVAPDLTGGHGNVAWGDAGIICPYVIYRQYADTRIIEKHYAQMAHYIDFLTKNSKNHIREQGAYGDWLNLGGGASSQVIGTAYYEYVTRLMSEMAGAIHNDADAKKYSQLADAIRDAFVKAFVEPDGSIKDSSQTGFALAFTMNLLPADIRHAAAGKFVDEIKKKDWHLATGFIGTPRLLPALTDAGRNDIAYKLFLTKTYPSWLYQVTLGATTMWERWDGWTPEKGFENPGMNSFNHYAFGSVGQWMYRTVGGIECSEPGFKKIIFDPKPGPGLTDANTRYNSIRGRIESDWKNSGDTLTFRFTVPLNTTAQAYLPTDDPAAVTESGHPAGKSPGVKFLWTDAGRSVYQLDSGRYEFAVKSP